MIAHLRSPARVPASRDRPRRPRGLSRIVKTIRATVALALSLGAATAAFGQAATLVTPGSPLPMSDLAAFLNSAFLSIGTCNSGSSAPANGAGAAAFAGECWIDTAANPWVIYLTPDATNWVKQGTLNTSTLAWTPYSNGVALVTGTSGATLPLLNAANTWSALQSFNNGDFGLNGSSSGTMKLEAPAAASTYVITFPAATDTVDVLGTAQTFTAAKTFTNSDLLLLGSSTGYTTFTSANSGSSNYTLTIPAATDTLADLAGSQAFTNKTYNGLTITGSTGTLTISNGKTLAASNSLTLAGTDSTTMTFPASSATVAGLAIAETWSALQSFNNGDLGLNGSSSGTMKLEAPAAASTYVITFPAATDTVDVLGTAQTFTAAKTFTNSDLLLLGSSTGYTTFTSANSGSSNYTLTIPAATDTVAVLGTAQTFTAAKTFTNSDILLLGSSTGYTTFTSANAGSSNYTLTFPAATDTVDVLGTAQTFTAAKTFTNSDIKLLGSSTGATTFTSGNSSSNNYTLTIPAATDTIAELGQANAFTGNNSFAGTSLFTGGKPSLSNGDGAIAGSSNARRHHHRPGLDQRHHHREQRRHHRLRHSSPASII